MSYDQARKDFEYLETIAELYDWVEIDAMVLDIMRNPTKKKAESMYHSCILLWFNEAAMEDRELPYQADHLRAQYC